ncbi:GntR family transcriptional regulator [Streptomyces sp. NPDC056191]|uniref:GntR family transcriptional regulator n=1 Tax=Streptomyces sp. NPDC056191 TaxID=3345742 RepID=UPI0035DA4019
MSYWCLAYGSKVIGDLSGRKGMSDDQWVSDSAPYIRPHGGGSSNAWTEEAARRGRTGGQRTLGVDTVSAPEEVRLALGLAQGAEVVVRRRLILLDNDPVELSDSYYPATIAAGTRLADPRKIPGGAVRLLADLGYVGEDTVEHVRADTATPELADLLGLTAGSAVLQLVRINATREGAPFEVSIMTMPPERHLTYRLRRET